MICSIRISVLYYNITHNPGSKISCNAANIIIATASGAVCTVLHWHCNSSDQCNGVTKNMLCVFLLVKLIYFDSTLMILPY